MRAPQVLVDQQTGTGIRRRVDQGSQLRVIRNIPGKVVIHIKTRCTPVQSGESDTDYFKFTVDSDGTVDIDLEALGFTFNVGPQFGGSQNPFDTKLRSDLKLEIFDSGLNSLGASDATGLGGMESLVGIGVLAGDYFIEITGADNGDSNLFDVQFYGLSTTFTSAVPEPTSTLFVALVVGGLGLRRRRA